jgi:serine/threonine protein kinase
MFDYFYSDGPFGPVVDDDDHEEGGRGDESHDGEIDDDDDDSIPGSGDGDRRYLIMILELCNEPLFDAIRDSDVGYLPEAMAAPYFRNMLDAVDHLHGDDVIHCDCKSLNFLLSRDRTTVKLADFGMSVRDTERLIVGGSPTYMAPEHLMAWRHMTGDFDHTTDVYSLGIILYELLVGYLPYEVIQNDDDDSVLARGDGEVPHPVLDLRNLDDESSEEAIYIPPPIFPDFLSEEAQDLIARLTEPTPAHRITLPQAKQHPWFHKWGVV